MHQKQNAQKAHGIKNQFPIKWPSFWPWLVAAFLFFCFMKQGRTAEFNYQGRLNPADYLYGSQEQHKDPVFDKLPTIDLSAKLGVGSDCGKIDFKGTLQASFNNILNLSNLTDSMKSIVNAGPMLGICYMSPTWCAILKHSSISALGQTQFRLNQCAVVDKYVDSRVEDYYQERQQCVHKSIDENGGNLEAAMNSCGGNNIWEAGLPNWAGAGKGEKTTVNRLIDSSAKWAGLDQEEGKKSLDLLKSMVGDTVVAQGNVSVEYGPEHRPISPRTYLQSLEQVTYDKLCSGLIKKLESLPDGMSMDQMISDDAIKNVDPNSEAHAGKNAAQPFLDRQTLQSLIAMSPRQRGLACKKLSDAIAMSSFSSEVNRSLDVLTTLAQNPNLPPQRKQEIQDKRKALKEQIEMTIELGKQRSDPMNTVLFQINEEGRRMQSESVSEGLSVDANVESNERLKSGFLDCSDGILCQKGDQ